MSDTTALAKDSPAIIAYSVLMGAGVVVIWCWLFFLPILTLDEGRRKHAWLAALDQYARTARLVEVEGEPNWQSDRSLGGKSVVTFGSGFDLYQRGGKRIVIVCVGGLSCPPTGEAARRLPSKVRVRYIDTEFGRLLMEAEDMSGKVFVTRRSALADIDRFAAWKRAKPFSAGSAWFMLIAGAALALIALARWHFTRRRTAPG